MTEHQRSIDHPPRRHRERHGRRRRGGSGRHTSDGAGDHAEDVRARPRRLARRLVLAAGLRPARAQGPQGVLADAHRRRRALAPVEQGRHPRHPHHRHRQRASNGKSSRTSAWWCIPTAAGPARARSSRSAIGCPRSSGSTPSSRRTASAASTSPPSSAARRCRRRSRRASRAAADRRPRLSSSTRRTAPGSIPRLTPQPNGVALQPIKLTGAREKVAKKTYIRAAKYPQPAFDKALAECKADKIVETFETTAAGHDVMVDAPEWLVEVMLQVS